MKLLFPTIVISLHGSTYSFSPGRGLFSKPQTFASSSDVALQSSLMGKSSMSLNMNKVPFFANMEEKEANTEEKETSVEEEVEEMVREEMEKTKKFSNLRNEKGVDYAPWMKITKEDEDKIRQVMKEKAIARRIRQEQEKSVSGNLYLDSQAQELSGTGLKSKILGDEVELEWATRTEKDCLGFIVRRRPAKTNDFSVVATYKDFAPLTSKGEEGGIYRYLDTTVTPGGWVYRISEASANGEENDLCQCLVELETEDERRAGLIAGIAISVLGAGAIAAGILLDPLGGY